MTDMETGGPQQTMPEAPQGETMMLGSSSKLMQAPHEFHHTTTPRQTYMSCPAVSGFLPLRLSVCRGEVNLSDVRCVCLTCVSGICTDDWC